MKRGRAEPRGIRRRPVLGTIARQGAIYVDSWKIGNKAGTEMFRRRSGRAMARRGGKMGFNAETQRREAGRQDYLMWKAGRLETELRGRV